MNIVCNNQAHPILENNKKEIRTDYMTRKELANKLGCSERTIKRWCNNGLPFSKIGSLVFIKLSDLDVFMNCHKIEN